METPVSSSAANNTQSVDDLLTEEMSRLSLHERYHLDMDVMGKNMLAAIEPPELSSMGLKALDKELELMTDRKFYDLALTLNSSMVQCHQFYLKFARAEAFDPTKAARRIEKYLEILFDNFGQEGLLRPIQLTDLDKVRDWHAIARAREWNPS
jgi:hypothetical protein